MKHNISGHLLFIPLLLALTTGCDGKTDVTQYPGKNNNDDEYSTISVSDYDFIFNDSDPGGSISFGSSSIKQCRLSFIKSKLTQGYTTKTTQLGKGDIDLTCMTDNALFALNESGNTYAEISVTKLDNTASITLSFNLHSIKTDQDLIKSNIIISLDQQQIGTLFNR